MPYNSLQMLIQKKRKSPHALIRDDPLAHVEASTRFLIPHKSTAVTKLDFITTPSSKVSVIPHNSTTVSKLYFIPSYMAVKWSN